VSEYALVLGRDASANVRGIAILSLTGQALNTNLSILSNEFHPEFTSTPFTITAPRVNMALSMPKWNTHSAFATPRTGDLGHIESILISGSYTGYADVRPDAVDRLRLDIEVKGEVALSVVNLADNPCI
jgi:hypothetical protein